MEEFSLDLQRWDSGIKTSSLAHLRAMNDTRKWYFGIKMPTFKKGSESKEEKRFRRLVSAIEGIFGEIHTSEGRVPSYSCRSSGIVDTNHSFIRVSACEEKLIQWAVEEHMSLKVKPKFGGGFQAITFKGYADGIYESPGIDLYKEVGQNCSDVLLPYQKQHLIFGKLRRAFDVFMDLKGGQGLKKAVKRKFIIECIPLHTLEKPEDRYPSRKEISISYLTGRNALSSAVAGTLAEQTYIQFLRDYFGEKVSLYFAFLHTYTLFLIPLCLPGLILSIWQYQAGADNPFVPVYAFIVSVWSTLFIEIWLRRNAVLSHKWNMEEYEALEEERDYFIDDDEHFGFYEPHGTWVDMEEYAQEGAKMNGEEIVHFIPKSRRYEAGRFPPSWFKNVADPAETNAWLWRVFKRTVSSSVILSLTFGVIAAALGLLIFRLVIQRVNATYGPLIAGITNAIVIMGLDKLFGQVAVRLTDWEHHRTQTQYEDNLIAKAFLFQFVNSYLTLFYIAYFKGHITLFGFTDECKDLVGNAAESCMTELSVQLTSLLLTRTLLGNASEITVPWIQKHLRLYFQEWQERKSIRRQHPDASKESVSRMLRKRKRSLKRVGQVERDAAMAEYTYLGVSGTFYDYNALAIQFGYVTLFAPAFPLAPVIALLSNVLENATNGFKLLTQLRRPLYRGAEDIGSWMGIFRVLSLTAVLTNSLIIGFTSNQLAEIWGEGISSTERLASAVIIEHVCLGIQLVLVLFIPVIPSWLREETARAHMVQRVEKDFAKYQSMVRREEVQLSQEIELVEKGINYSEEEEEEDFPHEDVS